TEALDTVHQDQQTLRQRPSQPFAPVPSVPITDIAIDKDDAISVAFTIDGHRFRYEELLDWAERGHSVALPDFRVMESHVDEIIPDAIPPDLRDAFRRHLTDSLAVFATDLRDRALDDEPLPE